MTVARRRPAASRRLSLLLGAAIVGAAIVAGCEVLPIGSPLDCGTVDPATCRRIADRILAQKLGERPGHRITTLRIQDDRGSYDLVWDDGNGESMIVD